MMIILKIRDKSPTTYAPTILELQQQNFPSSIFCCFLVPFEGKRIDFDVRNETKQ